MPNKYGIGRAEIGKAISVGGKMNKRTLSMLLGFAGILSLSAQEGPKVSVNAGAGFTTPVGNTGRNLDYGWNVRGGVGYNFSDYVGANLNVGFNSMGINSTTLANIGVPGGDVHILSATLDPIVHLNPHG